MNTTDLRNIDFDTYRHRAHELRRDAINALFDRTIARMLSRWARRDMPVATRADCTPAQCAG